jgi:hypothetical protein
MQTLNLPVYIKIATYDMEELNRAHKKGYILVDIVYEANIQKVLTVDQVPNTYSVTWSGHGTVFDPPPQSYNPQSNFQQVEKERALVVNTPYFIMKLNPTAEVIYGEN